MNGEVRSEGGGFDGVSSRDLWAVRNAAYQKEKGARKGGGGGGKCVSIRGILHKNIPCAP